MKKERAGKATAAVRMRWEDVPPWGVVPHPYQLELRSSFVAHDWRPAMTDPVQRRREYDLWWGAILDRIDRELWPTYKGGWSGAARSHMVELTENDFEAWLPLQSRITGPVTSPDPKVAGGPSHLSLFDIEDTQGWGNNFAAYGPDLKAAIDAVFPIPIPNNAPIAMRKWTDGLMRAKVGSTHHQFKNALQRPRGYQMAALMGIRGFKTRTATSADTPSMISGHCYHGIAGGMAVDEILRASGQPLPVHVYQALQQYAADLGDRRVFAGVHYPSDNISSWFLALHVADECCADPRAARAFVRGAIGRSAVAGAIGAYAAQHPRSALAGAWQMLQAEL